MIGRLEQILPGQQSAGLRVAVALCCLLSGAPALAQTAQQQTPPPAIEQPAAPTAEPAPATPDAPPATPTESAALPVDGADPTLPHNLSPWGMYQSADIVVKAVMIGLAFASLVTWTVFLAKIAELGAAQRRATRDHARLRALTSLHAPSGLRPQDGPVAAFAFAAAEEIEASAGIPVGPGLKERVQSRLQRIEAGAIRRIGRGTGILATIGSTAPFVGLFGTVWGIMNSFIGISEAQTTNLAVVAPGIAEALLATALGLVAAIPAVIVYNMFARAIAGYRLQLGDAAATVMQTLSRNMDMRAATAASGARQTAA